jgi:hypothetical protein
MQRMLDQMGMSFLGKILLLGVGNVIFILLGVKSELIIDAQN